MSKPFFLSAALSAILCAGFTSCQTTGETKKDESTTAQASAANTESYESLPYPQTPDEAIARLKEGNRRFVNDQAIHPNRSDERKIVQARKQTPFVAVMSCSDSRVPSEIVFDQGLGDIFVVRTAGQVMADASEGSLEFATAVLGVKAIVVMGHEKCGAVKGAIGRDPLPGKIEYVVNQIRPAIKPHIGKEDKLEEAAHDNVVYQVNRLIRLDPIIGKAVREGKIKVVGAYYNLDTGKVEFMDEASKEFL